ncbi:MAG: WD40 repeat domain-containing protein [Smithellaceae bacterium]|nr:WD40 repeat domain-containing protein [Smithellaceae bacterium]
MVKNIERFMAAASIGLFLTLTGCAEHDFHGANQRDDGLIFSADGSLLAPQAGPNPKVWDTKTRKILWETDPSGKGGRIDSVIFSPDGQTLASGDQKGSIKLRGARSGALFWSGKHVGIVQTLAFSPDGKFLASGVRNCGPNDKPLRLWDAETGELLRAFDGLNDDVYFVGFSPDGMTLVSSGGEDRTIKLWDAKTGDLLQMLAGHKAYVRSITFSPDGKLIASGSDDASIKLWNVRAGALLQTLNGHGDMVWQVVFSPDGKTLVSSGGDATIKMWDTATGALLRTLTGHHESVRTIALSPDGKLLASGSDDAFVRLWDAETGAPLRKIMRLDPPLRILAPVSKMLGWDIDGHSYGIDTVVFSPDGKTLASVSVDTVVKLWNVETAAK